MRRVSMLIGGLVLAMIATLLFAGAAPTASADPSATPDETAIAEPSEKPTDADELADGVKSSEAKRPKRNWRRWNPKASKIINDPTVGHRQRVIMDHVIKGIRHTRSGQRIRIVVWNFDDRETANALIRALRRGVRIQLITSFGTKNGNWDSVKAAIKRRKRTKAGRASFAVRCVGACRQAGKGGIMHAKFFTFSKIGNRARYVTMFGSVNLTYASGVNQWNDLITLRRPAVYHQYNRMFNRFRRDKVDPPLYRTFNTRKSDIRSSFFPANRVKFSPILREMKKVKCRGAARGYGNGNGRTKVRIAIAGWFDKYGAAIARRVRRLWDLGCDVKIVNTLTGRGINKALRNPRGRGRVPTREVTRDADGNGVPEKYLHLKYFTVDGVYGKDRSSAVLFTGSGNWTERARRSDELLVRLKFRKWARYYATYVDRLYNSPWAHGRQTTMADMRASVPNGRSIDGSPSGLPDWDW